MRRIDWPRGENGKAQVRPLATWRRTVETQNAVRLAGQQLLVGHAFGFGSRQRQPEQWQRQRQQRQQQQLRCVAGVVGVVPRIDILSTVPF